MNPYKPTIGSLEDLHRSIAHAPHDALTLELWVPAWLTLRGRPVRRDIAFVVLGHTVLRKGFRPESVIDEPGGSMCRYRRKARASPLPALPATAVW